MKNDDKHEVDITPDMKVGKLLEAYPDLEDVLIDLSPSFKKLRNPVLRKTVARVASLRQVAVVGGISLADLINALRRAAGLSQTDVIDSGGEHEAPPPEWFHPDEIVRKFDARQMIESGQQPMGTVLSHLKELRHGEIYELVTAFVPAPLIDIIKQKGYSVWTRTKSPDHISTFVLKRT